MSFEMPGMHRPPLRLLGNAKRNDKYNYVNIIIGFLIKLRKLLEKEIYCVVKIAVRLLL